MWIALGILIACIISAILYRAGGQSKDKESNPKWMPMWLRNTKIRDMGCPFILLALVIVLFGFKWHFWWVYIITFGATFGTLTTYWDFLFHNVDNFFAHGFAIGVVGLLLCFVIPWWIPLIRLVVCTLGMGFWSKWINNDVREEFGRGVFFII